MIEALIIAAALVAAVAYLVARAIRKSREQAKLGVCGDCHCVKKP